MRFCCVQHGLVIALALGAAVAVFPVTRPTLHAAEAPVTWRGQIAPLVYQNCTGCHHAGGSGPFDLTTYASARRWGSQMRDVTASRFMPPWLPEEGHLKLQGDRHLHPADIERLAAWVRNGMPEGEGPAPTLPVYNAGWQMGSPDLVLQMPEAVTVPASGTDLFMNFIFPATVDRTRWVRAMEIQPLSAEGSAAATHHANVILDRTASLRATRPATWRQGIPGMGLEIDSGDAFDPDSHFLFWKPDSTALVEPDSMPWRLDPGNDLVLNMHLKPTGKPEQVRARIGLYFTNKPAAATPMLLQLEHDAALDIPPGARNFVVSDELKLPVAVDLLGLYPHAHYLCRDMQAWAVLPGGRTETLLHIPDWDIDRQSVYRLDQRLRLPSGTVVHMRYTYDNSTANVHNPSSPPVRVHGGNRASDEMGHLWLQVLPVTEARNSAKEAIDGRLLLERAWMEARLRKVPGDTVALYNVAALTLAAGDATAAQRRFAELQRLDPTNIRVLVSLGSAMEANGDSAGAKTQFQSALARDPHNIDALFDLAGLDLRAGEPATAEVLLRHVLQKNPADTRARQSLADAFLQQGKTQPAIGELTQVVATTPEDPAARRLLAMAYSAEGESEKALAELKIWVNLAPNDLDAHRGLAQVLHGLGRQAEALAAQHEVVRLSPSNANDWNDLGVMEAAAGRTAEARTDLQHALRLDPSNASARKNLGRL